MDKPLKFMTHGQCDARPTVTFPAAGHRRRLTGTELCCLATEARVWGDNLPKVVKRESARPGVEPAMFGVTSPTLQPLCHQARYGLVYSGNVVGRISEVTLHRARLVLGWVTVFERVYHTV